MVISTMEKRLEEAPSTREYKPWKEKLHHQESVLDKKHREEASMEEENERERGVWELKEIRERS